MIDPNNTVRIKYVDAENAEVVSRVSGGVVPRIGEKVCIQVRDDEKNIHRDNWYEVDDVWWKVLEEAERHPDVVEVRLNPRDTDNRTNSEDDS